MVKVINENGILRLEMDSISKEELFNVYRIVSNDNKYLIFINGFEIMITELKPLELSNQKELNQEWTKYWGA